MAKLTSQQAKELAGNFITLAKAIDDYRHQNFKTFSPSQREQITDYHMLILHQVNDVHNESATLVMDDVQSFLTSFGAVTTQIKATYKTLQNAEKALNVAHCILTLEGVILEKIPQKIAYSLGRLVDTWNS